MEYTEHAVNPYLVGCYSCVYSGVWRYLQESMNDNPLSFCSLNKLQVVVYGDSCKIAMNKINLLILKSYVAYAFTVKSRWYGEYV